MPLRLHGVGQPPSGEKTRIGRASTTGVKFWVEVLKQKKARPRTYLWVVDVAFMAISSLRGNNLMYFAGGALSRLAVFLSKC